MLYALCPCCRAGPIAGRGDAINWNTYTLVCCHYVIMQVKSSWTGVMQGPSPDEVALVDAARTLGYEFVARSRTHVTLRLHSEEVRPYKTLTPILHPRVR